MIYGLKLTFFFNLKDPILDLVQDLSNDSIIGGLIDSMPPEFGTYDKMAWFYKVMQIVYFNLFEN